MEPKKVIVVCVCFSGHPFRVGFEGKPLETSHFQGTPILRQSRTYLSSQSHRISDFNRDGPAAQAVFKRATEDPGFGPFDFSMILSISRKRQLSARETQ